MERLRTTLYLIDFALGSHRVTRETSKKNTASIFLRLDLVSSDPPTPSILDIKKLLRSRTHCLNGRNKHGKLNFQPADWQSGVGIFSVIEALGVSDPRIMGLRPFQLLIESGIYF